MPTAEALAKAREVLPCRWNGLCDLTGLSGVGACEACHWRPHIATALDAFAQERAAADIDSITDQCEAHKRDCEERCEREKREAVEVVLRAVEEMPACSQLAAVTLVCNALDRLAGRPVGTTLARVRGTDG